MTSSLWLLLRPDWWGQLCVLAAKGPWRKCVSSWEVLGDAICLNRSCILLTSDCCLCCQLLEAVWPSKNKHGLSKICHFILWKHQRCVYSCSLPWGNALVFRDEFMFFLCKHTCHRKVLLRFFLLQQFCFLCHWCQNPAGLWDRSRAEQVVDVFDWAWQQRVVGAASPWVGGGMVPKAPLFQASFCLSKCWQNLQLCE